jgi:hypothetical protein
MFKKAHISAYNLGGVHFLYILVAAIRRGIPEKEALRKTVPPARLA